MAPWPRAVRLLPGLTCCVGKISTADPLMAREDGFHVARMLKASNASGLVPLIFVTALVDDDSRMRALEAGAEAPAAPRPLPSLAEPQGTCRSSSSLR